MRRSRRAALLTRRVVILPHTLNLSTTKNAGKGQALKPDAGAWRLTRFFVVWARRPHEAFG